MKIIFWYALLTKGLYTNLELVLIWKSGILGKGEE